MSRKHRIFPVILGSLVTLMALAVPFAHGSWNVSTNVPDTTSSSVTATTGTAPVAYFDSRYFTTIEAAVTAANNDGSAQTVYVIPGTNPTVTQSFTINSNITLRLPYASSESSPLYASLDSLSNGGGTTVYDSVNDDKCTVSNVYDKYTSSCTSTVTVNSGVVITNNGKIYIGGIQSGGGGGHVSGHIKGSYAKIVLKGTASIVSNGTMVNYGYIVGDSSTGTISLLGTTYIPFVLIEHRGGSNFCTLKMSEDLKGSPFNRFFFPSFIDVDVTFTSSSVLKAIPDLYADDSHNRDSVSIIGSGGLIAPGNNFTLNARFSFVVYSGTTKMPKHSLHFFGNWTLNSLQISVSSKLGDVALSTSSVYFPLSCYYDIEMSVASGESNASVSMSSQKVKILPGASVLINENVSVTSSGIVVYSKNTASDLKGAAGVVDYEKTNVDGVL
nr:hypothetical protein [Bacilli bacterium]